MKIFISILRAEKQTILQSIFPDEGKYPMKIIPRRAEAVGRKGKCRRAVIQRLFAIPNPEDFFRAALFCSECTEKRLANANVKCKYHELRRFCGKIVKKC